MPTVQNKGFFQVLFCECSISFVAVSFWGVMDVCAKETGAFGAAALFLRLVSLVA